MSVFAAWCPAEKDDPEIAETYTTTDPCAAAEAYVRDNEDVFSGVDVVTVHVRDLSGQRVNKIIEVEVRVEYELKLEARIVK